MPYVVGAVSRMAYARRDIIKFKFAPSELRLEVDTRRGDVMTLVATGRQADLTVNFINTNQDQDYVLEYEIEGDDLVLTSISRLPQAN